MHADGRSDQFLDYFRKTDVSASTATMDLVRIAAKLCGEKFAKETLLYRTFTLDEAISKNKKTVLVIELKRGRASDIVIGQIQRYMGYVQDELLEPGQEVKGIIIGLEADNRLKRALSVCHNIEFYRYQIDFKLIKS